MVKGGQAECRPGIRPDWAGVCRPRTSNAFKPENILPGDTKLSSKWKSSKIQTGSVTEAGGNRNEWLWPLMQNFTYCLYCQVRYGYIITDQELVVIRLKAGPEPKGGKKYEKTKMKTTFESLVVTPPSRERKQYR